MKVVSLTPMLRTRDLPGSIEFYRHVLGFECKAHAPERGWASLTCGPVTLMLSGPNEHEGDVGPEFNVSSRELDANGDDLDSSAALECESGRGVCRMKRVAVFGNAGGGKSTLARRLADLTGLPYCPLDAIQYRAGGGEVPHDEYLKIHADLLGRDEWIIDGFGCVASAWARFSVADTLVYIDLPLLTHGRWVTKRLVKGFFVNPEGWPENSPMWSSTMDSYRVLWRCHRRLTPRYRQLVAETTRSKRVHHLRSPGEMKAFLHAVQREHRRI